MPTTPSSKRVYFVLAIALVLSLAGAVGTYQNTQALISDNERVAHTYNVLGQLALVLSNLTAAESGERGYVATGDTLYLNPYYQATAGLKSGLAEVRSLTSDNPNQQKRLDRLEPLVDQRLTELKAVIDLRAASGFAPALQAMTTGGSQVTLVGIQGLVVDMVNEENQLLAARATRSDQQTRTTNLTLAGVSVVSFGLLASIVILLTTEVRQRRKTEASLANESRLLNMLLDAVPDTIYFKDSQSRFTRINRAQAEVLGLQQPAEAVGKRDADFFSSELSHDFIEEEQTILATGQAVVDRLEYNPLPDGQPRWFTATKVPIADATGKITGLVGISRNITQRRQAEDALKRSNEELLRTVAEVERHNREMSLFAELLDILQTCETSEEAYVALTHAIPKLVPSTTGALFIINASQTMVEAVRAWGPEALAAGEQLFAPQQCWALRRGRAYWVTDGALTPVCEHVHAVSGVTYGCLPIVAHGEASGLLHFRFGPAGPEGEGQAAADLVAARRVAAALAEQLSLGLANLKLREKLRDQSIRDPLTGLFNRRYLEESLEREVARAERRQTTLGILMLDLDHFKTFNDTFGHEAGDLLLREFGQFLRHHCRDEDIACRYGGEEFLVVLVDATAAQAHGRAEALRAGVKGLFLELRGQPLGTVTASIGVAAFPAHGSNIEGVIRAADAALYRAKTNGRDQVAAAVETKAEASAPANRDEGAAQTAARGG